jgi:hypothetical protein
MVRHVMQHMRLALAALVVAGMLLPAYGWADDLETVVNPDTVAALLGGFPGILDFLSNHAAPALLADPEIGPFFSHLTETPGDIEQCLAMLLDHDLGGSSPHFGAVLADGHQCRSSMTNIHRGLNIPDRIVDKFIAIVGDQAKQVGVAPEDIQAVAKVLDRYRGGVRNK